MKSYNFIPLLYLRDGNLLAYKYSYLYVINPKTFVVKIRIRLSLGWKEKYLSRINIIYRILRLGIRNAVQIDADTVLLFVNKRFYEFNLRISKLIPGFAPNHGVRALNVTKVKDIPGFDDCILFGAYFSPFLKREVPIFRRVDAQTWTTAYTFAVGEVNHIHNIIPDATNRCLWILAGDFDQAAAIWMARDNFRTVERIISGSQDSRACVAFPMDGRLVYATDSPFSTDSIRVLEHVDGNWQSRQVTEIAGSCIYGCRLGSDLVFSTTVEPDGRKVCRFSILSCQRGAGIRDQFSHLYIGNLTDGFRDIYQAEKDNFPYPLCQFGTLQFPAGYNPTDSLLVYHMATKQHDGKTVVINTKQ